MAGRTIVITGASDGLGAAAAKRLSRSGENVVVVGRSPQKTKAVATEIGADYLLADFTDLGQVRALAEQLLARYPRIDVLANNAGGIMGEREVTIDGHEKTFQVNHLAPFLLTTLLLDRLVEAKACVLNTSSLGNKLFGHVNIDDLDAERGYRPQKAYGDAKLENILFTKELHRRYHSAGISTAAFHPGSVASNFGQRSGLANDPPCVPHTPEASVAERSREGLRSAGLAGLRHAGRGLDIRRVLLRPLHRQSQQAGVRRRIGSRTLGPQRRHDRHDRHQTARKVDP